MSTTKRWLHQKVYNKVQTSGIIQAQEGQIRLWLKTTCPVLESDSLNRENQDKAVSE